MILHDLNSILIHPPKTAGNFLTKNVFSRFSSDLITLRAHQDGIDRFDVKGDITSRKHMTAKDYDIALSKYNDDISNYYLIIPVRTPIERVISFYFSPHRQFRPNKRATLLRKFSKLMKVDIELSASNYHKKPIKFSEQDFRILANSMYTLGDFVKGYENSKGVMVIRQKNLEEDLDRLSNFFNADLLPTKKTKTNQGTQSNLPDHIRNKAEEIITLSRHIEDEKIIDEISKDSLLTTNNF